MSKEIIKNKKILNGEPVLKGTRIPASFVVGQLSRNGCNIEGVKRVYPQLSKKQIQNALGYSSENLK